MASRLAQKPNTSSHHMKEKPIQDGYRDKTDRNPPPSTRHRVSLPGCLHILCLVSKKQIQMINNTIMNWRWRAPAQKIDPAMLASTVTEYLLSKIELGLLFAYGISECVELDKNDHRYASQHGKHEQDDNKINGC